MKFGSLFLAVVVALVVCSSANAERPRVLGRAIAATGSVFHGNHGGRENVYWDTGSRIGARIRAGVAWRNSPGHAANLRAGVGGLFGTRVVGIRGSVAVVAR